MGTVTQPSLKLEYIWNIPKIRFHSLLKLKIILKFKLFSQHFESKKRAVRISAESQIFQKLTKKRSKIDTFY